MQCTPLLCCSVLVTRLGMQGVTERGVRAQLDIERKLRALLTKEKEKAEEEAALAMGLCTGGSMLS